MTELEKVKAFECQVKREAEKWFTTENIEKYGIKGLKEVFEQHVRWIYQKRLSNSYYIETNSNEPFNVL